MPTTPSPAPPRPDVANAAIRQLVAAVGGRAWTAAELAELERLRGAWVAGVRGVEQRSADDGGAALPPCPA